MTRHKAAGWIMERLTIASAMLVALMVGAIFYYLASESRYAFDRPFPFGYRLALQPLDADPAEELGMDPNASLLAAHMEGSEGVDEKEEGILMPTLEELQGVAAMASGTPLEGEMYRDNWGAQKSAEAGSRFILHGFATAEYDQPTMRLRWEPDASFDPATTPYNIRLKLARAPEGVRADAFEIDLVRQPRGMVELPTWVAQTDDDREKGYVFELVATPTTTNFLATLKAFFKTDWAPTIQYPRYGFVPLILATLLITLIAMLVATPGAIWTAVYLSELAPSRVREWMKPIIELLASVPTVVLAYFGLMLVAPWLMQSIGPAIGMTSARNLLVAGLVLGVLILPTIISVAEDALRSVPGNLREGAYALGMTPTETIRKIVLPAGRAGIMAAVLLGFARAIGETMIVWILSGGTPTMPKFSKAGDLAGNLTQTARGIPDTIGIEMGNVEFEMPHYGHLFLIGLVLFGLTVAINLTGYALTRRQKWQQ